MLKLSVTTPYAHLNPTIAFKELDNRTDFHVPVYTIDLVAAQRQHSAATLGRRSHRAPSLRQVAQSVTLLGLLSG